MSRDKRKGIAEDTLQILDQGYYTNALGQRVDIQDAQRYAEQHTHLYTPDESDRLLEQFASANNTLDTEFEVAHQTTLDGARALIDAGYENPFVLNFASAKNPGGGFLGGSQAQEESIARATGLYPCQLKAETYYQTHRNMRSCMYTDHMIYSPGVPILKDESGQLHDQPYIASILTSAAVNTGVVKRREPERIPEVSVIMERRIKKVLAIAHNHQHDVLVLGAWGCGVFQNDPQEIAALFEKVLKNDFKGVFHKILFAIFASNERFITPFQAKFS